MNRTGIRWFIRILILMYTFDGTAQDPIILDTPEMPLNDRVKVYHSPDTLTAAMAWRRIREGKMPSTDLKTNPGMSFPADAYWLSMILYHRDQNPLTYYLEIANPQIDHLRLFELGADGMKLIGESGDQFPFDQRPVKNHNFVFPLTFEGGETKELLLNVDKRKSSVHFPLKLFTADRFAQKYFQEYLTHAIYFGLLTLVFLTSLLIGTSTRRSVFIYYALYVLAFGLWLFSRLGYSYQFITGSFPELNRHFLPVMTQFAIMMLILYIQSYFNTRVLMNRFHKLMNYVLGFFLMAYLVWAVAPDWYVRNAPGLFALRYALTFLVLAFGITACYRSWRQQHFKALMFSLAYGVLFAGISVKVVAQFGWINEAALPIDPVMLGFLIEVIILSTAMAIVLKKSLGRVPSTETEQNMSMDAPDAMYLTLKSKAVLRLDQIKYIKADDHYIELYLEDREKPEIDRNSLTSIQDKLPAHFQRIHRSVIVNMDFVRAVYARRILLSSGEELTISRSYKSRLNGEPESH